MLCNSDEKQVDIYGDCGPLKCPKKDQLTHTEECFQTILEDYKFYLAFENSNCRGYITEKFFVNGLGRDILPIVMGPRKEEYEKQGPLNSFIHVEDFESPMDLAEYLNILDKNDELYNSYFQWKGTGEVINNWQTSFCQICALLHDDYNTIEPQWYQDVNDWWRGPGVCTNGFWRDNNALNYTVNSYPKG